MNMLDTAVESLVSVVYVSSSRLELSSAELTALLADTRERNKRREITGMLLYRDGNFLQVIEGPESSIDKLLSSLQRDTRHTGIIILKRSKIEERQFGEWQMAFRDISNTDLKSLEGYSQFMERPFAHPEFQAKPNSATKLLLQFKNVCR